MENWRVSDSIAEFLEENKIKYAFGIVGAGDVHIFDAITRRGYTEIICVHHEQAAVMAMGAYYRLKGELAATIVTTGAGSTNTITGVVSCWMDSCPGIIIAGNEKSNFCKPDENPLRIWGVQGYDSVQMVEKVTKYAKRVVEPTEVVYELNKAKDICLEGRKGPVWLEIPMDIQGQLHDPKTDKVYTPPKRDYFQKTNGVSSLEEGVDKVIAGLKAAKRPVLWLGHGIRLGDALHTVRPLLEKTKSPALVTWQAIDIVESDHSQVFGRAGVYGQRYSNFVLQNSDYVLCLGTRLALPQIGYDKTELARDAKMVSVEIELEEVKKHEDRLDFGICADVKEFLELLLSKLESENLGDYSEWMTQCELYKERFPVVGPEHKDEDGFMNSYPFMQKISQLIGDDEIVVTDMGTALLSGFQIMEMNKNKRMFTSTGLGEMGYGLPAAIGASLAADKAPVLCLNCDGGMMMNLQELQTIVHHKLPVKILVFNNDGYLMIKNTQKGLFKGRFSGTNKQTGISCPDFAKVADAFDLPKFKIENWEQAEEFLPQFLNSKEACMCEVTMHPEQLCVPKLGIALKKSGEIVSPPLEDLSPLIDRETLKENMIVGVHPKSESLD